MLALNPGTTKTEIGYFNSKQLIWQDALAHSQRDTLIQKLPKLADRFKALKPSLNKIDKLDAIAARGGPLKPLAGGVYKINAKMLADYKSGKYSAHASNLGALLAEKISIQFDAPAYIVDPITTDEFIKIARISGVPGIERKSRSHALNIKFCAQKTAKELNLNINNSKFIVAHLGTGFSIAAVKNGKIIDVNDALLGTGPFSIERAGTLPISGVLDQRYLNRQSRDEIKTLFSKNSGLKGYIGTNRFTEIEQKIMAGDQYAELIVDAMVYQIAKEIGGLHASFSGKTDALIITGGLAHSKLLISKLNKYINYITPHKIFAGSFELEALAGGVLHVLSGEELAKEYT